MGGHDWMPVMAGSAADKQYEMIAGRAGRPAKESEDAAWGQLV